MNRLLQINVPIQVQASLALLSAQLCFSSWHVVGSLAFRGGTDPLVFVLYRLLIGTFLMHVYIKVYKMNVYIDPSDYRRMFAAGILSFLNVVFGSCALKFIAPSRFSIFQPCIPCITTAISMIFRLEQMSGFKLLGIALAVAGAFVAELWKMGGSDSAEEANVPLGVFLATSQVLAMGSLLVVVKPLLNKYEPAVVSGMYFLVSCAAIIVVVLCRIDIIPLDAFAFNGQGIAWLALMYVSIFATMYSFSAINWGGKFLPPTVTTVFFTFQPVGTIVLSATLLGASVTIPEVLGGLLIVSGLIVTSVAQSRTSCSFSASNASAGYNQANNTSSSEDLTTVSAMHNNGEEDMNEGEVDVIGGECKPRSSSAGSTGSGTYNPLLATPTHASRWYSSHHTGSSGCSTESGRSPEGEQTYSFELGGQEGDDPAGKHKGMGLAAGSCAGQEAAMLSV